MEGSCCGDLRKHRAFIADVLQVLGRTASVIPALRESPDSLSHVIGTPIHPVVPWLLSFLNGSIIVGFIFGHLYRWLPGSVGAFKGMIYGVLGWAIMGVVFFPMIGLGLFALRAGLGILPALFSLAMLLVYSVTMGMVYGALNPPE